MSAMRSTDMAAAISSGSFRTPGMSRGAVLDALDVRDRLGRDPRRF